MAPRSVLSNLTYKSVFTEKGLFSVWGELLNNSVIFTQNTQHSGDGLDTSDISKCGFPSRSKGNKYFSTYYQNLSVAAFWMRWGHISQRTIKTSDKYSLYTEPSLQAMWRGSNSEPMTIYHRFSMISPFACERYLCNLNMHLKCTFLQNIWIFGMEGCAFFFSRFLLHFCDGFHKFKFSGEICSAPHNFQHKIVECTKH